MAQVHGLGVGQAHHGRGVETLADVETRRELLVRGRARQCAAFVLDGQAAGEGQVGDELARHARQAVCTVVRGAAPTTRAHLWSNSTRPLAAARRSPE